MLSVFSEGVPVTEYSPALFDIFVDQTKVGRSLELLYPGTGEYECILRSGGRAFIL